MLTAAYFRIQLACRRQRYAQQAAARVLLHPVLVHAVDRGLLCTLRALADHINEILAEQLIGQREEEPFDNVQAFTNHPLHGEQEIDQVSLSVNSGFFRTRGEVELGPIRMQVSSWMQRSGNGVTRVYQRMRGTD